MDQTQCGPRTTTPIVSKKGKMRPIFYINIVQNTRNILLCFVCVAGVVVLQLSLHLLEQADKADARETMLIRSSITI